MNQVFYGIGEVSLGDTFLRTLDIKDILDKIIFGYLCQIITPSAFYQYIACISLKVRLYGLVI